MNRGINLFVLLMSCVILSVSALIGFKAYNDLKITDKDTLSIDTIEPNTNKVVVHQPVESPPETHLNTDTQNLPSDSSKTLKSKPKPSIDPQARIDQQKLYLVIAGGFQDEINAQSHRLQLKQLGYDAEIVRFKNSRLHIVCAGKFQEPAQANDLVMSLLQTHHIEAYVQVPI
ncbi:MAG: SPOR domain-containing protein [Chitinophagales bacterium]